MGLKNIHLKKAYSSDFDDVLTDFYIPSLKESIEYCRLAGFFSSTSLAIAARGIVGLIKNGGIMRLIVSPKLSEKDVKAIVDAYEKPEKYIEKKMLRELDKLEDEFVKDHVSALGWMVANEKLEIKIALAYDDKGVPLTYENMQESGLFHQKVGIFRDSDGNTITFSGSINETATGWLRHIEEFKVFRSWEKSEEEYVRDDVSKFERFWENRSPRVKIMEVPYAVKKKLIEIAPPDIEEINLQRLYKAPKITLWDNQTNAISAWLRNDLKGIFEMATGTGKTFAALGCLNKILGRSRKLLIIVTCPFQHLTQQWKEKINEFGITCDDLIISDSSNPSWKDELADSLIDIQLGHKNKIITLTTHNTFSSSDFIRIVTENKDNFDIFLIADEVHGLGARKRRRGLREEYNMRLGLSATPKRWFDTVGTNVIYDYFNGTVYEFGLDKAINTINPATGETYLAPYRYIPKFVSLTTEELEKYVDKTRLIASKFNQASSDDEKDEFLEILLFERANIVKNAVEKYEALEEILDNLGSSIRWTIIYCSPQQIDRVMEILNKRGLIIHRFTMEEGTTPNKRYGGLTERQFILQKFAKGEYQVLVAMKCLDEGVDVPPARTAILMASSGNPREYVQRIGRVIRRYHGKSEATIYDIVVLPSFKGLPPVLRNVEQRIFKKELERYKEIAEIAINNAEALSLIYKVNH